MARSTKNTEEQRLAIIAMSRANCRCLWFERFGGCLSAGGGK